MTSRVTDGASNISAPVSQRKPLFLTLLLVALTGVVFWSGSRYPALNEKALMGSDAGISGIGFETLIALPPDASFVPRVLATTVNWVYSNLQGMIFGIIFGALLMILVTLLYRQYQQQGLPKTLLGGVMGVPLGVCVNCATPIAQGIYASGIDAETALALMFSSPTLNVIVLSMMFALMPTHIAIVKVALTLVFILGILPWLMRWLPLKPATINSNELLEEVNLQQGSTEKAAGINLLEGYHLPTGQANTWFYATQWVLTKFLRNLGYICRVSLPLMVLAGFLGSLVITLLPFNALATYFPVNGTLYIFFGMLAIAVFGLFLPVPMSFDVIITVILLANGLPVFYAATLFFALGIFSIYPFGVIAKTLSKGMALVLAVALIVLSLSAGALSYQWQIWSFAQQERQVLQQFRDGNSIPFTPEPPRPDRVPDRQLVADLQSEALIPEQIAANETAGFSVSRLPFQPQSSSPAEWQFQPTLGPEIGIDQSDNFSALKLVPFNPFMFSRGIAAGDVHNDGWDDLAIASTSGVNLYANQQGKGYVEQPIQVPDLHQYQVATVALVDLNNDGWLDLFFTSYKRGNYVIYNQSGRFTAEQMVEVPNAEEAFITAAASFGDLDQDGDLDLVEGNQSQFFRDVHHDLSESRNVLLTQDNGTFRVQPLPGEDGETLSVLFTDFNNDNALDLLIGNDFYERDQFYVGDGKGGLNLLTKADQIIPYSTTWTMSLATADINNDLAVEMYAAQITDAPKDQTIRATTSVDPKDYCSDYPQSSPFYKRCLDYTHTRNVSQQAWQKRDVFRCQTLSDATAQDACIGYFIAFESRRIKNERNLCPYFPDTWEAVRDLCRHTWKDIAKTDLKAEVTEFLEPQGRTRPIPSDRQFQLPPMDNLLLVQQKNGQFLDGTERFGLKLGGWSWNAKFADLDNDQWQDLYIVNGAFQLSQSKTSNLLYLNQQGQTFKESATDLGLRSWQDTVSYTYNDYDLDGDLDIIVVPVVGPIMVYRNEGTTNHSIAFALKDQQGNRFGIGSKIVLRYGDSNEQKQIREIQAGGGFNSFDSPIVYFGLGETDRVGQVEVYWTTGERSVIKGDLKSGYRYVIERSSKVGG